MAIQVIIDSSSDIRKDEAADLGVTLLPMTIHFGEKEYMDGVDLSIDTFYEKLVHSTALPQTAQITPYRFEEIFREITQSGDEAIVITISSKLSGTYASALQAAKKFGDKVHIIDSLTASAGERLLCEYVLSLIKAGKTTDEIVSESNRIKSKITVLAMLDTLEYLKKGGRLSGVAAFAGQLLSLKPVIAVTDGQVKAIGKARGSKNGNNLLSTVIKQKGGVDFTKPYCVLWSGTDDVLLQKYVKDNAHLWQEETDCIPAYPIGATIGTHIGPGAIGVAFFEK